MAVKLATGIYINPTEKAKHVLKTAAAAGAALAFLATVYSGFSHYGSLKNGNSFSPDTAKANFYMKEMQKVKLPSDGIIKK